MKLFLDVKTSTCHKKIMSLLFNCCLRQSFILKTFSSIKWLHIEPLHRLLHQLSFPFNLAFSEGNDSDVSSYVTNVAVSGHHEELREFSDWILLSPPVSVGRRKNDGRQGAGNALGRE